MKRRLPYDRAMGLAEKLVKQLEDGCERVEIAGSLRRHCPAVGDIEIVVVPRLIPERDLFKNITRYHNVLDEVLRGMGVRLIKDGLKYKQFPFGELMCDLFIQPDPATWGVNFTLRTGSRDFSRWLVTPVQLGGAMPAGMYCRDARIWRGLEALETPEEVDVFQVLGLAWIGPEQRARGFWRR